MGDDAAQKEGRESVAAVCGAENAWAASAMIR